MEQQENSYARGDPSSEVVFVLRVRARKGGWWGQVKRLDNGSSRYVTGQNDLFALLDVDWQLAMSNDGNSSDGLETHR